MAELGINVDRDGEAVPDTLRWAGARWVRVVAMVGVDLRPWLKDIHKRGIKVLMLLVRESCSEGVSWAEAVNAWGQMYGSLVNAWQVMNEPDAGWEPTHRLSAAQRAASGEYPSSWCMDAPEVSQKLRDARAMLGNDAYIVGPGYSSGHWQYASEVDHSAVDAMAIHPYAKFPGTPELEQMISEYWTLTGSLWADADLDLWVTEYDSRTSGMHAAMAADARIHVATTFCWDDRTMVPDFGMIALDGRVKRSFSEFVKASGMAPEKPAEKPAEYVLGFKTLADAAPHMIGTPLENEYGFAPGFSAQRTSGGLLVFARTVESGEVLGFIAETGQRYRWDGTRLVEVAA